MKITIDGQVAFSGSMRGGDDTFKGWPVRSSNMAYVTVEGSLGVFSRDIYLTLP